MSPLQQKLTDAAWREWISAEKLPEKQMWAIVRDTPAVSPANEFKARTAAPDDTQSQRRVLFNGRFWMTRDAFESWRPCPPGEQSVTALLANTPDNKLSVIDGLEGFDFEEQESSEMSTLAELARLQLSVEVVRLYKPGQDAGGAVSGEILAVSRSYAAQSLGGNGVLIHDQSKLDRRLSPGERVTVNYEGGKAKVFNGAYYDVIVASSFLSSAQIGWLRMKMIEALSSVEGADQDDELIKEALHYALDKTAEVFGVIRNELPRSDIKLTVKDVAPMAQIEVANRTGQYVDAVEDVAVQDRFERYTE